jgi:hypothetical protein
MDYIVGAIIALLVALVPLLFPTTRALIRTSFKAPRTTSVILKDQDTGNVTVQHLQKPL